MKKIALFLPLLFAVTVFAKTPQSITFNGVDSAQIVGNKYHVSATASSGLPVTITPLNPKVCTLTTAVASGDCVLRATQSGNAKFAAAMPVNFNITVSGVPKWTRWELSDKYSFQYDPALWTRTTVEGADVLCLNTSLPRCTTFIDTHVFPGENGRNFTTMFTHVYESTVAQADVQETDHGKFDSQTEQAAYFSYLKGPYVVTQYAFPGTTKKWDDPTAIVFIGVFFTSVPKYEETRTAIEAVVTTFTIKTCLLPEGCGLPK